MALPIPSYTYYLINTLSNNTLSYHLGGPTSAIEIQKFFHFSLVKHPFARHYSSRMKNLIKAIRFSDIPEWSFTHDAYIDSTIDTRLASSSSMPGMYPHYEWGMYVARLYLGRQQRTLAIGTCYQCARFADAIRLYFWKYRTRKARPPTDFDFCVSMARAQADLDEQAWLRGVCEGYEKLLTKHGELQLHVAPEADMDPRSFTREWAYMLSRLSRYGREIKKDALGAKVYSELFQTELQRFSDVIKTVDRHVFHRKEDESSLAPSPDIAMSDIPMSDIFEPPPSNYVATPVNAEGVPVPAATADGDARQAVGKPIPLSSEEF